MTSTEELALTEALRLLADLGHWTQVADYLAKAKVQGVPGSPRKCPLAQWLTQATGAPCSVRYSEDDFRVALLAKRNWPEEVCQIPEMVGDFVWRFDDGQFPALIGMPYSTGGSISGQPDWPLHRAAWADLSLAMRQALASLSMDEPSSCRAATINALFNRGLVKYDFSSGVPGYVIATGWGHAVAAWAREEY